jgi:precorrin-6Y C5,15-methyltransferase (decarboxylating)
VSREKPPWKGVLKIVGVPAEGRIGLSERAKGIILSAKYLVGSLRQIELVQEPGKHHCIQWEGGVEELIEILDGKDAKDIVLLSSGDPNFYGIANTLGTRFGYENIEVIPSVSSIQYAAIRMGIKLDQATIINLYSRKSWMLVHVLYHRYSLIMCNRYYDPLQVRTKLLDMGVEERATVYLMERLGAEDEKVRVGSLRDFPSGPYDPLSILGVMRATSLGIGLALPLQQYVSSNTVITKPEVRAVSISYLNPAFEDTIWDIGSGSGTIAIEVGRLAYKGKVFAIEKRDERIMEIMTNIKRHNSWNVIPVKGQAPEVLASLPPADAVFIGGSEGKLIDILDYCKNELLRQKQKVKLAANFVTLDSLQETLDYMKANNFTYRLSQLMVAHEHKLNGKSMFKAENPVYILGVNMNAR